MVEWQAQVSLAKTRGIPAAGNHLVGWQRCSIEDSQLLGGMPERGPPQYAAASRLGLGSGSDCGFGPGSGTPFQGS